MAIEFENRIPEWKNEGTEPVELREKGFEAGYKPPAPYFNWFWSKVSKCINELQAKIQGIKAEDIGATKTDLSNVSDTKFEEKVLEFAPKGTLIVEATSTDGQIYEANVDDISELPNGMQITIIPNMTSTSRTIKLNINGLGEIPIRQPLSFSTFVATSPTSDGFLYGNVPCRLMYHANYVSGGIWLMADKQKTSAQDLYGVVPLRSGGLGVEIKSSDTDEEIKAKARVNLDAEQTAFEVKILNRSSIPQATGNTIETTYEEILAAANSGKRVFARFYKTDGTIVLNTEIPLALTGSTGCLFACDTYADTDLYELDKYAPNQTNLGIRKAYTVFISKDNTIKIYTKELGSGFVAYGGYSGNGIFGKENYNYLDFPFAPKLVYIIWSNESLLLTRHEETDEIYINEINTLPGFTNISMYDANGQQYNDSVYIQYTDTATGNVKAYQDATIIKKFSDNYLEWYVTGNSADASKQMNKAGRYYEYVAIG